MKIQLNNKQNIFFCSDPHYNHGGMVRGTSKWDDTSICRDFDTLEEHDDKLVNNINSVVKENDILFCLGDWSFGSYRDRKNITNVKTFRDRLNVKTIHLILGNHDDEIRKMDELKANFTTVNDYLEIDVSVIGNRKGVKAIKKPIVLSHYAHRVWNGCHKPKGSYHLYGHSHGSIPNNGKSMDVGFDCHKGFRPFSFMEIDELLCDKLENQIW